MDSNGRIKDVTLTAVNATAATSAEALNIGPGRLSRVMLYRASSASSPTEFHVRFYRDAAKTKLVAKADWTATTSPTMPADTESAEKKYKDVWFDALYVTVATDTGTLTGNLQIYWIEDKSVQSHPTAVAIAA